MKEPVERVGQVDPEVEAAVRASFSRQAVMGSIGASLVRVGAGEVVIALPFSPAWTQQNGFVHAGIPTTVLDSACGYAAISLLPAGTDVLTVEFKTNLLARRSPWHPRTRSRSPRAKSASSPRCSPRS